MKRVMTIAALTLFLTGCSLAPEYHRPTLETPSAWSDMQTQPLPSALAYDWWTSFKSSELNEFMAQALENNTDLRAGLQRIEQSRAALKIAGADLLPSVSGSAGAARSKSNPASGQSRYSTSLSADIGVAYELDLFGANRADIASARAGYQGSLYDQETLKLSLMGDVASSYFTLVNLRERLKIADNNLKNSREVLRIIKVRVREGAESDLELAQQKSAVASSEAALASLAEKIKNAENALAFLLGQPPQTITVQRQKLDGLSIPDIAPGQPSELLERRPDLRSSEADLQAANADIGAARAAFFPSLSLGLGDSLSMAGFGDPSSTLLSLTSSLSVPIFQGGRLQGGLEQATARQLELVETYRGNVLTAFQEVEDALAAVKTAQIRETALKTSMQQSRRAFQLSKSRYDAGSIDYQTLLDTQNAQLSTEDSYAQARLARLTAAITLYRTLGGGWTTP
jgi:multidrug efflux system outer membrane protein